MNTQDNKLNEAAEKYADESFIPTPNKSGEERAHLVGHKHPFGYRKHFNSAKKHFIAGVKSDAAKQHWYAQSQLYNKQESAGVWVKASERLPNKYRVCIKYLDEDFSEDFFYETANSKEDITKNFDVGIVKISWLDESQPTTKPISDEFLDWLNEIIRFNKESIFGVGDDDVQMQLLEQVKEKYQLLKTAP